MNDVKMRDAIRQAMRCIKALGSGEGGWAWEEVLAECEQALASPAQGEAVVRATVIKRGADRTRMSERMGELPDGTYSLYTAPPAPSVPPAMILWSSGGASGYHDWKRGDEIVTATNDEAAMWNACRAAMLAATTPVPIAQNKRFSMRHKVFGITREFDETNAPSWLTCEGAIRGSTSDMRWFWLDHVLKLEVGKSVATDFNTITRIA